MPYRRRASYGRRPMVVVNSTKNFTFANVGLTGTTTEQTLAEAQDSATLAVDADVERGCSIRNMYIIIDVCGLGGTGVLNQFDGYLMKNPGSNLTPPNASTYGISNEKKFIFKHWSFMIMRVQDGTQVFHWEGWVKIPKRYQRMGANDKISFHHKCTTALTGHASIRCIYKWFK